MLEKYEYHFIGIALHAFHIHLFLKHIFFHKWAWDWIHIYFCFVVVYLSALIFYAVRIYLLFGNLNLKNFPVENIASCKDYKNEKNVHPYAAFERSDLINMKLRNLLYGTIFMASWKMAIILILSVFNLTMCVLISAMFSNIDDDSESIILTIYGKFLRQVCKRSLWLFGINKIENTYLCDKEWPKNIVSNHISALDPFYFISEHMCSFVAKKSLQRDRLIGASARTLKCVFVYREKFEDRQKALELIKERQILVNDKKKGYPSFVIFSEGTTSNGLQLIEQKKGAFFSLVPITPVLLIYEYNYFNPSYDILPFSWWLFLSATTYESTQLKTYWLPKVHPPTEEECANMSDEERIDMFHDKVSRIMFENMKKYNKKSPQHIDDYNDWPGSLRLKLEYFQSALGKVAMKHLNKEKNLSEKR